MGTGWSDFRDVMGMSNYEVHVALAQKGCVPYPIGYQEGKFQKFKLTQRRKKEKKLDAVQQEKKAVRRTCLQLQKECQTAREMTLRVDAKEIDKDKTKEAAGIGIPEHIKTVIPASDYVRQKIKEQEQPEEERAREKKRKHKAETKGKGGKGRKVTAKEKAQKEEALLMEPEQQLI